MRISIMFLLATTACRSDDKQAEPSGEDSSWWEEIDDAADTDADEGSDTDKPEDTAKPADDTGKPDVGDKVECGEEVVAGAACEGDWTTTLCTDAAGELWWCDGGSWTNDK